MLLLLLWFQLNGETMLLLEYDIATNTETVYNSDKAVVLTVRYNAAGSVTHRLSHQADKFTRHHDVVGCSDFSTCVCICACRCDNAGDAGAAAGGVERELQLGGSPAGVAPRAAARRLRLRRAERPGGREELRHATHLPLHLPGRR